MFFDTTKIATFLREKDFISYIDIIDILESGTGDVLFFSSESGIIIQSDSGTVFAAITGEEKEELFENLPPSALYSVHSEEIKDYLSNTMGYECDNPCYIYGYEGAAIESNSLCIRTLDESYLPFVMEHYGTSSERDIRNAVWTESLFGAFSESGEIMGFAGFHSEGSMGMLEVLPEFRRKGVGETLLRYLVSTALGRGRLAYCNIYLPNEASIRLNEKIGMKRGRKYSWWLWKASDLPEESPK